MFLGLLVGLLNSMERIITGDELRPSLLGEDDSKTLELHPLLIGNKFIQGLLIIRPKNGYPSPSIPKQTTHCLYRYIIFTFL
jgi:hypothetical protein